MSGGPVAELGQSRLDPRKSALFARKSRGGAPFEARGTAVAKAWLSFASLRLEGVGARGAPTYFRP